MNLVMTFEDHAAYRREELLREAAAERLVALAARARVDRARLSPRLRLASALRDLARRIEPNAQLAHNRPAARAGCSAC
jgi:hypothetical protein